MASTPPATPSTSATPRKTSSRRKRFAAGPPTPSSPGLMLGTELHVQQRRAGCPTLERPGGPRSGAAHDEHHGVAGVPSLPVHHLLDQAREARRLLGSDLLPDHAPGGRR